jgi:protein-S-isoprenylcysteine O-methyltransferase Ste14
MSAQVAVNLAWAVWYATWIAAVVFSARTQVQMKTDAQGWHRMAAGVGALLIFLPATQGEAPWALPLRRLWPAQPALDWSLFAAVITGFAFCWWARLHLGRLWSGFVTLKEDHRIVDTGPYGLVRHPIYSGVIWAGIATALVRATPAAFLGAVLLAWGFALTAKIEEGFLSDQLGAQAYGDYRRRVGMLVPGWR